VTASERDELVTRARQRVVGAVVRAAESPRLLAGAVFWFAVSAVFLSLGWWARRA
jgi:hypothetical protein